MARILITLLTVIALAVVSGPTEVYAQASLQGDYLTDMGPRKQLATIIFSGLAGAILGLSTLSFYGRPQDKLSNIAVGFAVGVIAGTVYTTYKTATRPYGQYTTDSELFLNEELMSAHLDQAQTSSTVGLSYRWEF